ncbi:MAG TPA: M90 family metallopeptidase [Halothiobacillus sp.]|nr:M90 family metallopeptidase [Halothiobacillus sp.]
MWRRWRMRLLLKRHPIPQPIWHDVTHRMWTLKELDAVQMAELRELSTWFLAQKSITGAQGLEVTTDMKVAVAAQACLLILSLGTSYFEGWVEVILYPGAFRAKHPQPDEFGLVHHEANALSGESWMHGPVVLSWGEVESELFHHQVGRNVVVHEFAHKLDGLNGAMNGMPPLHHGMNRTSWTEALAKGFETLRHQVAAGHSSHLNPYAATNPAEFFAVISEYFFTAPNVLKTCCPDIYRQLDLFYRPHARRGVRA